MKDHQQKVIALMLFFFSGVVSLIFQVIWLKKLVLVFGNTVWAVSTLLTAFMAGLALGSWLFGRMADRTDSPLKIYGILEGVISVYGVFSLGLLAKLPLLYVPLYALSGGDNFLMGMLKFLVGLLILLPPTVCMGGTLPLLAKQFTPIIESAGSSIGGLYTINTLGAVFGTFVSGFFFLPLLGLKTTTILASCLGLTIMIVAIFLTRGERSRFRYRGVFKIAWKTVKISWILWVYFGCGFAALAYEVIWNRILTLYIGSSVYSYSMMLTIYLIGVALGAAIMSFYINKCRRPILVFALIQWALAFDLILIVNQFGNLSEVLAIFQRVIGGESYGAYIFSLFSGIFQVFILPTLLFGASFPLAISLFVTTQGHIGQETGKIYTFNTIGNILGSFVAGFLLIPVIGAQLSLLAIASLNLFIGIYLFSKTKIAGRLVTAIVSLLVLIGFYSGYMLLTGQNQVLLAAATFQDRPESPVKILSLEEDVYATVTVEERDGVRGTWRQLSMNGVNVAGTSSEMFSIQKLQGHLPLLLHKNPKRVLHIGFGSGGTAWAVSRYPVEKITIAEISKSVIQRASHYFEDINHGVLRDPRVDVVFTDGRNRVLGSTDTYDVILSDSIHPRFSGNGSLYTYEYYQLLKSRLNPGGVVSQWLPFYSVTPENFKMIIKSFSQVFPNTTIWYPNSTINAYVIVIGKLDGALIDFANMEAKLKIPEVAADLQEINTATPYKILDYFICANEKVGAFVGDVPLHTDDNMAVEYSSGRNDISRWQTSYDNFLNLLRQRTSVKGYLTGLDTAAESREKILATLNKYEQATTYNLTGQQLFWDGKQSEAFKSFDRIPQINPDDLEPVEYFGASYQQPFLQHAGFPKK